MKVRNISLTLGLMAALHPAVPHSFAQNATLKSATPIAASAPTAVPSLVPYSGTVGPESGKLLTGEANVTFQIFKDEAGGEALWSEIQAVALDATGHYTVQLGATSPNGLPSDLFATGEARWLEVQIAGQNIQPRVLIASVPYALKAGDATTLNGLPASAYALAGVKTATAATALTTPTVISNADATVTTPGGTTGYLPVFTGASTIADSILFATSTGIGVGDFPNSSAVFDVNGKSIWRGLLNVARAGNATAAGGFDSYPILLQGSVYNSSTKVADQPVFQLQVEPTNNNTATPGATFNLLAGVTGGPVETGLYFNTNGTVHFAPGQTFPGTGAGTITGVTAGTALTGGGTSGDVKLNVDLTKIPELTTANTFTTSQTITGGDLNLPATTSKTVGVLNIGGVPYLHGFSKANDNVFVGDAGNFTTTGFDTASVGFGSLANLTSGFANTAIGSGTLLADTTGNENTAVGIDTLFSASTGGSNTAIGAFANVTSGGLNNTTEIGASATAGQSNTLILGNTDSTAGQDFVNVGIGTETPISVLEASVSAVGALGPVLTLTNTGGDNTTTFADGAAAIDFNTIPISTSGTYNPGARIEAVDDGVHSTDINFLSNIYGSGSGSSNGGLQTNMTIFGLSGTVSIGTNAAESQLEVIGTVEEGVWAFGGTEPDFGSYQGLNGLRAGGGPSDGTDTGGIGAWLFGGDVDDGGTGTTGEGLLVWTGETNSGTVGLAADFEGDVFVDGTLSASVKDFKIDHPQDPANKYLVHTSVESSEMMNIYTGNVTTDELGLAIVTMPSWFSAENTDFRYQLTVVDERFAQAVVSKRMDNNQFTIHTNASNVGVSWQITAVRQDAYAKAHPLVVEQLKKDNERGFYQHPELYGQPKEKQTQWGVHPAMVQKMVADKQKMKEDRLNRSKNTSERHDQPASAVNRKFATRTPNPVPSHAIVEQTASAK